MKKLIFLLTACVLGACTKLDEQLLDTPNSSLIKDETGLTSVLNGMYSKYSDGATFELGVNIITAYSDDIFTNSQAGYVNEADKTFDASSLRIANTWQSLYVMVNAANYYLEAVENKNIKVTDEFKERTIGDALFTRAFAYYYLVRLFGGVPIRTQSFTLATEKFSKRSSVDEVYQLILKDFKEAAQRLPSFTTIKSSERGRATKGAAWAMLASASLTYANYLDLNQSSGFQQYYQQAKDYADTVIISGGYQLVNDYADLFDVAKERDNYQKEVIYGIQFTRDPFDNSFNSKGSMMSRNYNPPNTDFAGTSSGFTLGYMVVQPWFYDMYNQGEYKGDYRVKASFTTSWVNARNDRLTVGYPEIIPSGALNGTFCYSAKYKDPAGSQTNCENDLYTIRLSEIYIIKAEAENELNGPTTIAYNAFNQLRIRARKANGTPSTVPSNLTSGLTKDQFRMAVFNERGLEFFTEGGRYFDLVRMKSPNGKPMYIYQVEDFLPGIPAGNPVWNSTTKKWTGGRKNNRPFQYFTSRNLLFPIPLSELSTNPNFGNQNPGW